MDRGRDKTAMRQLYCTRFPNSTTLNKNTAPVYYSEYRHTVTHCCQVYHVRL